MTDYLEPLTQDNVDALLEQTRRLSAALSGLGYGLEPEEGVSPPSAPPAAGPELESGRPAAIRAERFRAADHLPETVDNLPEIAGGLPETADHLPEREDSLPELAEIRPPERTAAPWREEIDGGTRSFGLLGQLERLERAAALPEAAASVSQTRSGEDAGTLTRGRRPALPGMGGYPGLSWPEGEAAQPEGWGGSPIPERNAPLPGGEIRWAERADRAFRRDSRRYDGGFYLY